MRLCCIEVNFILCIHLIVKETINIWNLCLFIEIDINYKSALNVSKRKQWQKTF